jgi:integrase
VNKGKTGARMVVVDERLGGVMEAIEAQHPDPKPDANLWVKPNGEKTTRFGASFKAVLKRTAYSMRHYAITDAIERGVNLSSIADNVGNSVEQISKTYNHVVHVRHAAELLKGTEARRK